MQKYLGLGWQAASSELPRSGRPRKISDEAIAWILQLACQKPKDLGYAPELWTYSLLQTHVRRQGPAAGYKELATVSQSRLHNLLEKAKLRPHKVRYYVERRDPEFEPKMATVLHVYKELEIVNDGLLRGLIAEPAVVTISYDEKPGIQALAHTTADLPPVPGTYASHLRDYEYERLGTGLLVAEDYYVLSFNGAGLDLHSGRVTEIVSDTHKSSDFIYWLTQLDQSYPAGLVLRLILDNHSAHVSKETQRYLATRPT